MQHQEKRILALQVHCQWEWLEIGSVLSASAQTTLLHAAHKTLDRQPSASASPDHFSGVHTFEQ